jgi:uncharacterized protein
VKALGTTSLALAVLGATACLPADWGANAILHPYRKTQLARPALPFRDISFTREGVTFTGWMFPAAPSPGERRGLLVYLHGIADNRSSGLGVAQRFTPRGWDVLVYDARAHGASGGAACTYGFHEKRDLSAALDAVGAERAVLFGSSLGAAVALQAAAAEPRVRGVIAQSSFSSLRSIVQERGRRLRPLVSRGDVDAALRAAERQAAFRVDEVSPLAAAALIKGPVLLIHGERDRETSSEHSRRLDRALTGPHRLLLVPGAGHNDVLAAESVWKEIEEWLAALP